MLKWNEFSKRKRKLYKWNSIKCFSTHTPTLSIVRPLARARSKANRTDYRRWTFRLSLTERLGPAKKYNVIFRKFMILMNKFIQKNIIFNDEFILSSWFSKLFESEKPKEISKFILILSPIHPFRSIVFVSGFNDK